MAVASGIALKTVSFRQTFRLAWHFGLFQALMVIAGFGLGLTVTDALAAVDHWIAFTFLAVIGVKMILEAWKPQQEKRVHDPTRGMTMVMLSVATSIDAFAVGLSMGILGVPVGFPALVIGAVACFLTATGMHLGKWVGQNSRIGDWAGVLGGIILLAIGVNILHEHGVLL